MYSEFLISIFLIILSSIFEAAKDTLVQHYSKSIFYSWPRWFSSNWQAKYKVYNKTLRFIYIPISDFWHFSKTCQIVCYFLAIYFYIPVFGFYDLIILWGARGIVFEIFYSKIFIKG